MAASTRPDNTESYPVHERLTLKTADRHDHSFCGIVFPVQCKKLLPTERIVITSISVRGRLGNISVWVSNNTDDDLEAQNNRDSNNSHHSNTFEITKQNIVMDPTKWTQIYSKICPPSKRKLFKLDISHSPIILHRGQVRGIYIHSTLANDKAIIYDNYYQSTNRSFDSHIRILPGMAHLSTVPFSPNPLWGWGDDAWRYDRKFVGQLDYGVVYKLWNPRNHLLFGGRFQTVAMFLFACQRRSESPISKLPDDCIFSILNMCKWDWVCDDPKSMIESYKRNKERAKKEAMERDGTNGNPSLEILMTNHLILYRESENDDFDLMDERGIDIYELAILLCTFICFFSMFTGIFFGYLVR